MLAGCFWRTYGRLAATHVDVLLGMARKGVDLVANGRFTAESMPELTYPLERARAFAEGAHARAGPTPPESLTAFDALLGRYRSLVDALDRVRRAERPDAARHALEAPLAAVEAAGTTVQASLRRVRGAICKALPAADEGISYQIPTYKLHAAYVIYFAGWKEHYSLYPATRNLVAAFKEELAPYEVKKGTIRFPLSQPVPVRLIERLAKFLAKEATERARTKLPRPKKRS